MSKKTRNIAITVLLCIAGIALIGYGITMTLNKEVDVVTQAQPDFTDSGEDYMGNPWKLEAYNNENGKYVVLEVYMEEDHDMKWYGEIASGPAEINYIIYQNDHYVMSINPNLDQGSSELGFIFDKLEPNHSETATYLYYGLSINVAKEGTTYHVIGGELTDEVTDVTPDDANTEVEDRGEPDAGLNPVVPELETEGVSEGLELNSTDDLVDTETE